MQRMLISLVALVLIVSMETEAGNSVTTGARTFDQIWEATPSSPADTGFDNDVRAITVYRGDLIVGGYFNNADGFSSIKAAGYDGTNWYAMTGFPNGNSIHWLHVHEDTLYAGQALTQLCSWDGSSWTGHQPWLGNTFGYIWALETWNNELYVGGGFDGNASQPSYIAKWTGGSWDTVGTGLQQSVTVLHEYNGELVAGGAFSTGNGSAADYVASWNGSTWSPLGTGLDGLPRAMTIYNSDLICAGLFTTAGGNSASNIASWNGSSWSALGAGCDGTVEALTVWEGKLVVGGRFANAGGSPAAALAVWDGANWSTLGPGLDNDVYALGVWNGYLIAGGAFSQAGGSVALWDGSTWRPVGDIVVDVEENVKSGLPEGYALDQNYPNPFNPETSIEFSLPHGSKSRIEVINVQGQLVTRLVDQFLPAGTHRVVWDGTNDSGDPVATGVYFYRLVVDGVSSSKKMILLK